MQPAVCIDGGRGGGGIAVVAEHDAVALGKELPCLADGQRVAGPGIHDTDRGMWQRPAEGSRAVVDAIAGEVCVMTGLDSVCANTMLTSAGVSRSTRRTSSVGTAAPPDTTRRRPDKSAAGNSFASSIPISIVGTPIIDWPCSSSRSRNCSAGSKAEGRTSVPRTASVPSTLMTHPAVWDSGIGLTMTSPGSSPARSAYSAALSVIPA